ncbi:ParA family protein [Streptomyces botrytidirepellens]|uniref:ParA family protein n=2 Tax=Streptomyces botrytidirepellens TaxID=2486417 RepID=A0A3M8SIH7_9ACTN|nr:ParA family protein [Streptomyces botrytidirepellens]
MTNGAELTARFIANHLGGAGLSPRGQVQGKTSLSPDVAQLLAQRADNRIHIADADPTPITESLTHPLPDYTPIILDCPPSSPRPADGLASLVWEEQLRILGLPEGEDRAR